MLDFHHRNEFPFIIEFHSPSNTILAEITREKTKSPHSKEVIYHFLTR